MATPKIVQVLKKGRGATAAEYIIALVLIAMVALGIMKVFGGTVESKFGDANEELTGQVGPGDGDDDFSSTEAGESSGSKDDKRRGSDGKDSKDPKQRASTEDGNEKEGLDRYRSSERARAEAEREKEERESGSGRGGSNNKTTVGSGGEGHNPNGPAAKRPTGLAGKGCEGVNPIVMIGAAVLVLLLFFVMSSGKRS